MKNNGRCETNNGRTKSTKNHVKNGTKHKGPLQQTDVVIGSRSVVSSATGEGRLIALSLAAKHAREKLKQKASSESEIQSFLSSGSDDVDSAESAESFLGENFDLSSRDSFHIDSRTRFIQRTQKEMLISTTV